MFDRIALGNVLMFLSVIPLGFIIYTLTSLGITITHPRVIVELVSFQISLFVGVLFRTKN
jgi:uncharacterized membrane protein YjjP (DUF1212 family)